MTSLTAVIEALRLVVGEGRADEEGETGVDWGMGLA